MCTLVCAWRALRNAPVALAATRDEALDRPASPPRTRETDPAAADALAGPEPDRSTDAGGSPLQSGERSQQVLAPRDERAGGTWVGVNDRGVVAAIANRPTPPSGPEQQSRGMLVGAALACASSEDAGRTVERALDRGSYAGFTLLLVDAEAALLVGWDGSRTVRTLDPGVHVVTNASGTTVTRRVVPGGDGTGVAAPPEPARRSADALATAILTRLRVDPGEGVESWLDRAGVALGDHEIGACLHGEAFGTRSASLVAVGDRIDYQYTDGPPCEGRFAPIDHGLALD